MSDIKELDISATEELEQDVDVVVDKVDTEGLTEESIDNLDIEDVPEEIVEEASKEFHLDPKSGEDRRRILESYKKSLRKRVFAPLIGPNEYLNPIDLMKAEEEEKRLQGKMDIYDLMERRIEKLEKDLKMAMLMSRVGTVIAIIAVLMIGIMFSVTKI